MYSIMCYYNIRHNLYNSDVLYAKGHVVDPSRTDVAVVVETWRFSRKKSHIMVTDENPGHRGRNTALILKHNRTYYIRPNLIVFYNIMLFA